LDEAERKKLTTAAAGNDRYVYCFSLVPSISLINFIEVIRRAVADLPISLQDLSQASSKSFTFLEGQNPLGAEVLAT
jgi:hypothetical protein